LGRGIVMVWGNSGIGVGVLVGVRVGVGDAAGSGEGVGVGFGEEDTAAPNSPASSFKTSNLSTNTTTPPVFPVAATCIKGVIRPPLSGS